MDGTGEALATGGRRTGIDRRAVPLLLLAVLVGARVWFGLSVPPNIDEAYYFGWGEHLQLSYLDHAPLSGWLSALGRPFGTLPVAVHLAPFVSFGLVAFAISLLERRRGADGVAVLWALVIWLSTPLFHALSILNYPDHILIGTGALAIVFFHFWIEDARPRDLFAAAFFLGLAGLSKYPAVLIGLALVLSLAMRRELRPRFRDPRLYLAGALTLLLVSPVLIWNLTHGLASVAFHGGERFGTAGSGLTVSGLIRLFGQMLVYLSPFGLIFGLMAVWRGRRSASGTFLVSLLFLGTLPFLALSLWAPAEGQVQPHWLVTGLLPLMLLLPDALTAPSRRLFRTLHVGFGVGIVGLLCLYYGTTPLLTEALNIRDREASVTYGQDQLVSAARAAAEKTGARFFAFPSYREAAKFAFELGTARPVLTLDRRPDQYDLWQAPDALGADTIIIVLATLPEAVYAPAFASVEPLGEVTPTRFGRPLATYRLVLGKGFRGQVR